MGDKQAFALLAHRHLGAIESYALRMLGDRARAQDVTQEVFLRLWRRADRFDVKRAKLSTWLHQIAHNLCIDQFRDGARYRPIEPFGVGPTEGTTEGTTAGTTDSTAPDHDAEQDRALQVALGLLPERQRTALVLTYYQGLPNRDVAQIMDLSVRALESLLVRARKALRESMESLS